MKNKKIIFVILIAVLLIALIAAVYAITQKPKNDVDYSIFKDKTDPASGETVTGEEIVKALLKTADEIGKIKDKKKVIAVVNGKEITNADLVNEMIISSFSDRNKEITNEEYLQKIIAARVIAQEAEKYGVAVSEDSITEDFENEIEKFDEENVEDNEMIKILGITKEEMSRIIANNRADLKNKMMLMNKVVPMILSGELKLSDVRAEELIGKITASSDVSSDDIMKLQNLYENELVSSAKVEIKK